MLDVGCGTGTLACRLACAGIDVIGVDPARASLDVAHDKPAADGVTWIHSDATSLSVADLSAARMPVDLAVMTGNVAQVFVTDDEWSGALGAIGTMMHDDGRLVFETRDPARRAWEWWDTGGATTVVATESGNVETWTSVLDASAPLVRFRHHYRFEDSGQVLQSDSTLRFRSLAEIRSSLAATGFTVDEVRDAPDRPGLEFVVIASRSVES